MRVQPEDFHISPAGVVAKKISICCKLVDLTCRDQGTFAEYLTYDGETVALYVYWTATRLEESPSARRWVDVSVRTGKVGSGPTLEPTTRELLSTAYLRPLRDAKREMSPGRGSRLSQILAKVPHIGDGTPFDVNNLPKDSDAVRALSLLGLSDYLRHCIKTHSKIAESESKINTQFMSSLFLKEDSVRSNIDMSEGGDAAARLRQILERLELGLLEDSKSYSRGEYGLGSTNLLYMACELLLLGQESEGLPLLLIEEPEAHLHPQRQLRLMDFLTKAAAGQMETPSQKVQVIVSTHSPNLASKLDLENLILLENSRAFSLAEGQTRLEAGDYSFLQRFLDVTKANLFFAHGVIVVEGFSEVILLPIIAKLLGKDLTEHGVSIVNTGGTGLSRYSKIFQRSQCATGDPTLSLPVACVTDTDVMPNCAPDILGLDKDAKNRKWQALYDLKEKNVTLEEHKAGLRGNDGQSVKTFVSDHWTLEYDLAVAGLAKEVYIAASLAKNEKALNSDRNKREVVEANAIQLFEKLEAQSGGNPEILCSKIYHLVKTVSKPIAAQYFADALMQDDFDRTDFVEKVPQYLIDAITYATSGTPEVPVRENDG